MMSVPLAVFVLGFLPSTIMLRIVALGAVIIVRSVLRVVVLAVLRIIVLVAVLRVIVATLVVVIPFGLIAVSAWNADLRNLYQLLENARNAAQDRHGFALR